MSQNLQSLVCFSWKYWLPILLVISCSCSRNTSFKPNSKTIQISTDLRRVSLWRLRLRRNWFVIGGRLHRSTAISEDTHVYLQARCWKCEFNLPDRPGREKNELWYFTEEIESQVCVFHFNQEWQKNNEVSDLQGVQRSAEKTSMWVTRQRGEGQKTLFF